MPMISANDTRKCFSTGAVIFRQGEIGSSMISIVSGTVRVIKDGVEIAARGVGEYLGEMSLIEDCPRFATVVAASDCEILEFTQDEFIQIVESDPAFAIGVIKNLSHKLRESDSLRMKELEENNLNLMIKNKELLLVNDFLEQLITGSPAAIVITDKRGVVKKINPAGRKIFEMKAESANDSLLACFTDCNPISNLWRSLQPSWIGECKATVKGRSRTIYVSISRLYSYDPESSYLFICEDISELIELNERVVRLQQFATESEIASEIAHDIKNYIAVLSGNFELLQLRLNDQFKQEQERPLKAIEGGFRDIENFVESLMSGDKDVGTFALKNPAEIIRVIVKYLAPQKRFSSIKLTTIIDPSFPTQLRINEIQFQQLLLNLLINAADALKEMEGEILREIRIELNFDKQSHKSRFIIADNGPGIPATQLAEIFSKRFSTKERGHGIGLITVKKIVELHQGAIDVESTPGKGTTFTISLPQ